MRSGARASFRLRNDRRRDCCLDEPCHRAKRVVEAAATTHGVLFDAAKSGVVLRVSRSAAGARHRIDEPALIARRQPLQKFAPCAPREQRGGGSGDSENFFSRFRVTVAGSIATFRADRPVNPRRHFRRKPPILLRPR